MALLLLLAGCTRSTNSTPRSVPASVSTVPRHEVRFTDITVQAGIHWKHFSGARGRKYMPEGEMSGCAFIDYNNDGKPDILLLSGADWPDVKRGRRKATPALYRNDGNGHFTDVTADAGLNIQMYAMGVAVGDYDNDGWNDLYITCAYGASHLFHNDGKGHFLDVSRQAGVGNEGRWGASAAWIDYDKDGLLDLAVTNYCKWSPQTDLACPNAKGAREYCTPQKYDGQAARLYHNVGGGKFRDVTEEAGFLVPTGKSLGIVALDYDDDGWPDIAIANDQEPNCLFHNERNGTFKEVGLVAGMALPLSGVPRSGMGIDAGDIEGTGLPSVLVSNFTGEGLSLFENQGKGSFVEVSANREMRNSSISRMGWGLFFFDYDLDGKLDAFVANGHLYETIQQFHPDQTYSETPLLFHNEGNCFHDISDQVGPDFLKPMVARGAAFADIDRDGDLDILIVDKDEAPHLLRNDGGNQNNWLRVQLQGTKSNRNGYGAKITLECQGVRQTRWCKSEAGYLSASEAIITFGLGSQSQVDSLTITWPSGIIQRLSNVRADQLLLVKEERANSQSIGHRSRDLHSNEQ